MSKHTKGWKLVLPRPRTMELQIAGADVRIEKAGRTVASIRVDWDKYDDTLSTARLLLAAPELLKMLKKHLAWYDGEWSGDPAETIAETRAAIVKAEKGDG